VPPPPPNVDDERSLSGLQPIPVKKTLMIINSFIINTVDFLNKVNAVSEQKLRQVQEVTAATHKTAVCVPRCQRCASQPGASSSPASLCSDYSAGGDHAGEQRGSSIASLSQLHTQFCLFAFRCLLQPVTFLRRPPRLPAVSSTSLSPTARCCANAFQSLTDAPVMAVALAVQFRALLLCPTLRLPLLLPPSRLLLPSPRVLSCC
jgi:hypothetical protein